MDKLPIARDIIRKHVMYSMGGSMIPIPIVDLAAVTAIQLDMIKQISNLYHVDYSESSGKSLVGALAGNVMARVGASFIKGIPVIGSILGGVSLIALSGAATYALGEVFLSHVVEGGTFKDFNAETYRKYYKERFEEGKQKAEEWQKRAEAEDIEVEIEIEDDNDQEK